jgi:hypothetical protein
MAAKKTKKTSGKVKPGYSPKPAPRAVLKSAALKPSPSKSPNPSP